MIHFDSPGLGTKKSAMVTIQLHLRSKQDVSKVRVRTVVEEWIRTDDLAEGFQIAFIDWEHPNRGTKGFASGAKAAIAAESFRAVFAGGKIRRIVPVR